MGKRRLSDSHWTASCTFVLHVCTQSFYLPWSSILLPAPCLKHTIRTEFWLLGYLDIYSDGHEIPTLSLWNLFEKNAWIFSQIMHVLDSSIILTGMYYSLLWSPRYSVLLTGWYFVTGLWLIVIVHSRIHASTLWRTLYLHLSSSCPLQCFWRIPLFSQTHMSIFYFSDGSLSKTMYCNSYVL